jgi:triosephosphate isomerase
MAKSKREILIVGNWKTNPSTLGAARKLFLEIRDRMKMRMPSLSVVVAPPTPFIADLARLSPSGRIALGAQTVSPVEDGAHTGDVAASMLASVSARYVIVGHSERRAAGETDDVIAGALERTLKRKLTAILCVGETSRDKQGSYFTTVETQLTAALQRVPKAALGNLVIAYEPVWAIGTGNTATPEDAHEMKLFIQKVLVDRFGRAAAEKVRIIYGGSVNPKNAAALLTAGEVDGFLVGGASLRATDFISIIHAARDHA